MKLNEKQKVEIAHMYHYTKNVHSKIKYPDNYNIILLNYAGELQSFKIKLENLIFDTDCYCEQVDILWTLIDIEQILTNCSSDDFQRYTNMGLRIAPNEAKFHSRIGNISSQPFCVSIRPQ